MVPVNAHILRKRTITHNNTAYDIHAYVEPTKPNEIKVEASRGGNDVVITYPDGLKARLTYSVDLVTALDIKQTRNVDAADELINTAEGDIRRLV